MANPTLLDADRKPTAKKKFMKAEAASKSPLAEAVKPKHEPSPPQKKRSADETRKKLYG